MQAFNQKYDYGKRAEYQVARLEATYLAQGENWENAPQVYQITVLNFAYDKKSNKVVSRYALRTEDGRKLSDKLNVIFIDLTRVNALERNLGGASLIEKWALFLKNADNPDKNAIIKEITNTEAGLMEAKKSLSNISSDRSNWIAQYRQEIFERDIRSGKEASRREGMAQQKAADEKLINKQAAEIKRQSNRIAELEALLAKTQAK